MLRFYLDYYHPALHNTIIKQLQIYIRVRIFFFISNIHRKKIKLRFYLIHFT